MRVWAETIGPLVRSALSLLGSWEPHGLQACLFQFSMKISIRLACRLAHKKLHDSVVMDHFISLEQARQFLNAHAGSR